MTCYEFCQKIHLNYISHRVSLIIQ